MQRHGRRRERDQDAEDRAPLLASDAESKAARRARRAQKRCVFWVSSFMKRVSGRGWGEWIEHMREEKVDRLFLFGQ